MRRPFKLADDTIPVTDRGQAVEFLANLGWPEHSLRGDQPRTSEGVWMIEPPMGVEVVILDLAKAGYPMYHAEWTQEWGTTQVRLTHLHQDEG